MGESSGSETKRISGFVSPVSRVVDGTISLGACLSSTLCPCPWIRHNLHPLGARGGGGALVQCTTCTAAHGRLASLSPTAEPTLEFYVLWKLLYSLLAPHSLSSSNCQEGKEDANPVSSAYIFSLPPASFQVACAAGRSVWVQGDMDPPPRPGLVVRKTEVWVLPPQS